MSIIKLSKQIPDPRVTGRTAILRTLPHRNCVPMATACTTLTASGRANSTLLWRTEDMCCP